MRYWLYLAGKIAAWFGAMYGLQWIVEHSFKIPPPTAWGQPGMFLHDFNPAFTFSILAVWLVAAGTLAGIIWDHRRRCRTCMRKLIMPLTSGSWGHMVIFGRPRTELICPYGHGTLTIEELQITGHQIPDWQPHDDNIWKELESYYQARK